MAQYILNMGGNTSGSTYFNAVDVFQVTTRGVTKVQNHGLALSVARNTLTAASCGNYILAMGGYNGNTSTYLNTVDVFKITDNGVEAVQNHGLTLSVARHALSSASCGNYILAMGGYGGVNFSNAVDVFQVTTNGVTKISNHGLSLSVARNGLTAASCGNYILAMGGLTASNASSNVVDVFKVTTNGVEAVQNHGLSLSVARNALTAASVGNYILAMGGSYRNTSGSGYSDAVDVFKVTENGVEVVQNHGLTLSEARNDFAAVSCGRYVLAMGGNNSNVCSNVVDVFEVTDNGVTKVQNHGLSLSEARSFLTAASVGNYILAMGGLRVGTFYNTVDIFQCFE